MFDRIEVKCPSDLSEKTRKIKLWRMESVKSWMIFTKSDTIGALDHLKITCSTKHVCFSKLLIINLKRYL